MVGIGVGTGQSLVAQGNGDMERMTTMTHLR